MQLFPPSCASESPCSVTQDAGLLIPPEYQQLPRERIRSCSSSSSGAGLDRVLNAQLAENDGTIGSASRGDCHHDLVEPLSPGGRKASGSVEPRTPPKKPVQHVFESPTQGKVTTRSPSSTYGKTPSPQQTSYRQRLNSELRCSASHTQTFAAQAHAQAQAAPNQSAQAQAARTAQAVTPGQAGPTAYRVAAPATGPAMGPLGQPMTPVQRGPPFQFTPTSQDPACRHAGHFQPQQATWGTVVCGTPSAPPHYSPVVFQFPQRPAPHILTPAPQLPFGSPPLRQGHGLTPGPKHSPPEGNGANGHQDRDASISEHTQQCMEKWRRGSN